MRLTGGCTYVTNNDPSNGSVHLIAGAVDVKSFDEIVMEWFSKAANLEPVDAMKCVPTYLTLEGILTSVLFILLI
jgi:hypothetical protein